MPQVRPTAVADGLPVLGRGRHRNPSRGACFLEYTALLAGEPFSDEPARFTAALGVRLTEDEDRAHDGGREVGRLFWYLMDRPGPAVRPAAWTARLVARLELLHTCYEQALAELRPDQSAGPAARVTVAECEEPSEPVQLTVSR